MAYGGKNPVQKGLGFIFIETLSDGRGNSKEKYVIADS